MTATASPAREQAIRDKALAKALEQVALNRLPRLIEGEPSGPALWSVHSRTTRACRHCGAIDDHAGDVWTVRAADDGVLACDCPATAACWHLAIVALAREGRIGFFDSRLDRRPL